MRQIEKLRLDFNAGRINFAGALRRVELIWVNNQNSQTATKCVDFMRELRAHHFECYNRIARLSYLLDEAV